MKRVLAMVLLMVCAPVSADVYTRVVDVGAGLCCVVAMPNGHYMIYDAGNFEDNGQTAITAIQEIIPEGSVIDLLVLSHCDADHLAAVPEICQKYTITRVIRDGFERETDTWQDMDEAIEQEVIDEACADINLKHVDIEPGESFTYGPVTVTFVCGFYDLPDDWPNLPTSESRNARSVVMRLDYAGRSMLFTGDTVGRLNDDPDEVCVAAEKFMVDNAAEVPIDVDVMIAPHHGANNGSSADFIAATSPEYVIFPAGHKHEHPRHAAVSRYLAAGVDVEKMFRTDRGDNEGDEEWPSEDDDGADPRGDDDVEILLSAAGDVQVRYREELFFAPEPEMFASPSARPAPPPVEQVRGPKLVVRPCPRKIVVRPGHCSTQRHTSPSRCLCYQRRIPFLRVLRRCK